MIYANLRLLVPDVDMGNFISKNWTRIILGCAMVVWMFVMVYKTIELEWPRDTDWIPPLLFALENGSKSLISQWITMKANGRNNETPRDNH